MGDPLADPIGQRILGAFTLDEPRRSWLTITTISRSSNLTTDEVVEYIAENPTSFEVAPIQPSGISVVGPSTMHYKFKPKELNAPTTSEIVYFSDQLHGALKTVRLDKTVRWANLRRKK